MRAASTSMLTLRGLLLGAAAIGEDVQAVLSAIGIDAAQLADADARVPAELALKAWRELVERSDDPFLGLHIAERTQLGAFDVLDYAARTSPDLATALRRTIRYHRVLDDAVELRVEEHDDEVHLIQDHQVPRALRVNQAPESFFAFMLVRGRQLTGSHWCPRQMRFRHAAPPSIDEHQRIFGCPVTFSHPMATMVIDRAVLAQPVLGADPHLGAIIERHAEDLIARLEASDDPLAAVQRAVTAAIHDGDPSLSSVAARLAVSPRTLQRRLRDRGCSLKQLVDDVRFDLAQTYLAGTLPLCEVAYLLGFSELSAFSRAFKRWAGTTPAAFRAKR